MESDRTKSVEHGAGRECRTRSGNEKARQGVPAPSVHRIEDCKGVDEPNFRIGEEVVTPLGKHAIVEKVENGRLHLYYVGASKKRKWDDEVILSLTLPGLKSLAQKA